MRNNAWKSVANRLFSDLAEKGLQRADDKCGVCISSQMDRKRNLVGAIPLAKEEQKEEMQSNRRCNPSCPNSRKTPKKNRKPSEDTPGKEVLLKIQEATRQTEMRPQKHLWK